MLKISYRHRYFQFYSIKKSKIITNLHSLPVFSLVFFMIRKKVFAFRSKFNEGKKVRQSFVVVSEFQDKKNMDIIETEVIYDCLNL